MRNLRTIVVGTVLLSIVAPGARAQNWPGWAVPTCPDGRPAAVVEDQTNFQSDGVHYFWICSTNNGQPQGWSVEPWQNPSMAEINNECIGACGAGCSPVTCADVLQYSQPWDNGDGRTCQNIEKIKHCYTAPMCWYHDVCGRAHPDQFLSPISPCNYGARNAGIAGCIGYGYIGCAGGNQYNDFDQGLDPRSPVCSCTSPCNGQATCGQYRCGSYCGNCDPCGGRCQAPFTCDPSTGNCTCVDSCNGPLCGQLDGCGRQCPNLDDTCSDPGGYINACGTYCPEVCYWYDCFGVCNGPATTDWCGVCGGDGTECLL